MKPCYYGGACRVIENEVKCICPRGFLGDRCEIRGARAYFIPCVIVQQFLTGAFTELTIFRITSALAEDGPIRGTVVIIETQSDWPSVGGTRYSVKRFASSENDALLTFNRL